jgi:hypothetical protein
MMKDYEWTQVSDFLYYTVRDECFTSELQYFCSVFFPIIQMIYLDF